MCKKATQSSVLLPPTTAATSRYRFPVAMRFISTMKAQSEGTTGISRRGGTRRSVGLAFSLSLALSLSSNYYTVSRMLYFTTQKKYWCAQQSGAHAHNICHTYPHSRAYFAHSDTHSCPVSPGHLADTPNTGADRTRSMRAASGTRGAGGDASSTTKHQQRQRRRL